jgi:hypothetical protein
VRVLFGLLVGLSLLFGSSVELKLLSAVNSWSDAINSKDYSAMRVLYADSVIYYGKIMPRYKCIADKKRALRKRPNFHQEIDDLRYKYIMRDIYRVSFDKYVRYTRGGKIKLYPSYLYIDISSTIPKIVAESDRVTDLNLLFK